MKLSVILCWGMLCLSIHTAGREKSTTVNTLNPLRNTSPVPRQPYWTGTQLDDVRSIGRKALDIRDRLHLTPLEAVGYNKLLTRYFKKNHRQELLPWRAELRYPIGAHITNKAELRVVYALLACFFVEQGEYRPIISLYHKATGFFDLNDTLQAGLLSKMNQFVACAYYHTGSYDTASLYYFKVLAYQGKPDKTNYRTFIEISNGLGAIAARIGDRERALAFFEVSRALSSRYRDTTYLAQALSNISSLYFDAKDYEQARYYGEKTLDLARQKNYPEMISSSAYTIAAALIGEGKPQEALYYGKEAYRAALSARSMHSVICAMQVLGYNHVQLGAYREAESYLLSAEKMACETGDIDGINNTFDQLSKVYERTGRYREAYEYKRRYAAIVDSMRGKENVDRTNRIEARYRLSEKDKDIARKKWQLSIQQSTLREKNAWIGGVSAAALLLTALLTSLYRSHRHRAGLQQAMIHNLQKEQELSALLARLEGEEEERKRLARDLHDGIVVRFSAVKMNMSILPDKHRSLAGARDFTQIVSDLDDATHELRKTAHNLMPDVLLEGGLSEAAYYFCKDMQQGTGLNVDFQQFVDLPRLKPEIELSVYRIIQELLQNILKHASATQAMIQLSFADDLLNITIEDNGKGFDIADAEQNKRGIGLRNIADRVTALNGHWDIQSAKGRGTTVYLEFETKNHLIDTCR